MTEPWNNFTPIRKRSPIVLPQPPLTPPTIENTDSNSGTATSTLTISNFVVTNANLLLVGVHWSETGTQPTVSSVTWNGSENGVEVDNEVHTNDIGLAVYQINNPTATTNNIVVTLSGAVDEFAITCTGFVGANTTLENVTTFNGSGSSNVGVDVVSDDESIVYAASTSSETSNWLLLNTAGELVDNLFVNSNMVAETGEDDGSSPDVSMKWDTSGATEDILVIGCSIRGT